MFAVHPRVINTSAPANTSVKTSTPRLNQNEQVGLPQLHISNFMSDTSERSDDVGQYVIDNKDEFHVSATQPSLKIDSLENMKNSDTDSEDN